MSSSCAELFAIILSLLWGNRVTQGGVLGTKIPKEQFRNL